MRLLIAALFVLVIATGGTTAWDRGAAPSGQGGGASLALANAFSPSFGVPVTQRTLNQPAASTADYYHEDGLYWTQPYDLNAMGTWGQGIATAKGFRYVWLIGSDHPICTGAIIEACWGNDASYIYVGYSNDPAVLPDPSTMSVIMPPGVSVFPIPGLGGTGNATTGMVPWLVYNPDDLTNHAYVYAQCIDTSGGANNGAFDECVWVGNDFDHPLTAVQVSHLSSTSAGFSSFQTVYRTGVNTWVSWGGNDTVAGIGRWTSTDGKTFTRAGTITTNQTCPGAVGTCVYNQTGTQKFTVAGQDYAIQAEDARASNGAGGGDGGQYVTMAPVDAGGNILASPPVTRISAKYTGVYPGPTYLQNASAYCESGVCSIYASHGFYSGIGCTNGAFYLGSPCPAGGGGLSQQYLDLYLYVADASAAVNGAPFGVQAAAAAGTVSLAWYDKLPNHTYRVYRGTTAGSQTTLVGDVTGGTATDTPTAGSVYYYKVVLLNAGVEKGSRVVSTYVSSSSAFVNKHITRALAAGADVTTIDSAWLDTVDGWLNTNGLQTSLLFWTDAAFGIVRGSGSSISRIMDLGTTRLPRGGDYTPRTPANTTYGATSCNSAVPGWVNANTSSQGYYGGSAGSRLNQIRNKTGFSFLAAYQTSNTSTNTTLLAEGTNGSAFSLQHVPGSPGQAQWKVAYMDDPPPWTLNDSKNLTAAAAHVIGGTYDGTTAVSYVEGSAGSGASPAQDISPQIGQTNNPGNVFLLNSGASQLVVATGPTTAKTPNYIANEALYTGCDLAVFDKALTPTQMANWSTLIRTRIGP